jgi:hypothetical protein
MSDPEGPKAWEPPLFEWSQHGPIPITLEEHIEDEETRRRLAGEAAPYDRTIRLDSGLPDLALLVVHFHEWLHIVYYDAGIDVEALDETLVQTTATALAAREMFHRYGVPVEVPVDPDGRG